MAGTPGWCCLVSFTWAYKCQAQTPHGSWEVGEQWPPCHTLAGHLRRGLGFPSGSQRLWTPSPADSSPGRVAQSWGLWDKAGHWEQRAGCWTRPPRTASSRSSSAASGGLGRPGPWERPQHRDGSRFPFLSCPRQCVAPTRSPVQTQLILRGLRINICMEAEIAPPSGSFLVGNCSGGGSGSAAPGPSPATAPVACVFSVSSAARILLALEAVRRGAKCSEKNGVEHPRVNLESLALSSCPMNTHWVPVRRGDRPQTTKVDRT